MEALTHTNEVMVMIIKTATCLALAAACLATAPVALAQTGGETVIVTPPPRVDPGDVNWNPVTNLKEAQEYDRLLETNPAFRMARIQKECGPITDPQLHADCVASFNQLEPMVASTAPPHRVASSDSSRHHQTHYVGSSRAPRHYQSQYGR
jgi:hypothetical protein